uniref:Uncharacterized protein n=1 Tax=Arundo donax TaxID=35708 RepID=A0A0A9EZP8_ARUDO
MGQASLQKASEIYESIDMHEKAATCYIKLGDYKRAGMVYMEKCGTSRLEDAGDCFAITECWSQAAEVYFRAKCYKKCLSSCSKGKLLSLGLEFLRQLDKENLCENVNSSEVAAVKKTYLENCALHYFERGDIKHMMPFVKAFDSLDHIRAFLNSRNLMDELLSTEMEMGNFLEAAVIAKHKGDVLLEVNMLEKAELFENATQLLLLHVTVNSLWVSHSRGWPPKSFAEKEKLLAKVKEMAKEVSECYLCFACLEADALSDAHKSLTRLTYNLLESRKCGNLFTELISARSIIDVHLQSQTSGCNFELEPVYEDERCYHDMLARNLISPVTLACVWNHWRSIVVKALMHLHHSEYPKSNDSATLCDDLCVKYFGLRKDGDDRYMVLNMDSTWLSKTGRSSLQQDGNRFRLDALQFQSCAHDFLMNELSYVGFSVLKKLESFVETRLEQASSPYARWRIITIIYEIAKFLKESEFAMPKYSEKLRNFFILCERHFFELLSLAWRDETTKSFLCILDTPAAFGLIADALGSHLGPANKLTHGHLGRITMLLLLTARLDEMLISRLMHYLDRDSEWAEFFESLKRFIDSGVGRSPLISKFKLALEFTLNASRRDQPDYISPLCYVDLMESLAFLSSSYLVLNGFMFCTKSVLIKMLKSRACKDYLGACLVSSVDSQDLDLDRKELSSGRFISLSIRSLLRNKCMIQEWFRKTSTPTNSYVPILLRLVVMLYMVTLTLPRGDCYEVSSFLMKFRVFENLPWEFSEKIISALQMNSRTRNNFIRKFADALAAIGNRLVVLGSPKGRTICRDLNAYIVSCGDLSDVKGVMALLCPEEPNVVKQESPMQEEIKSDGNKIFNVTSGNLPHASAQDNKMESGFELRLIDDNIPFWEKFEVFRVFMLGGQKDARFIIQFLRTALSWLEQRGSPNNIDAQLLEEIRHICSQFEEQSLREKRACLTVEDLYSMWKDGENKLQKIISFLRTERATVEESDRSAEAAAAVQFHTDRDDEWSECSENEPDTGGTAVEPTKEEATAVCSTSKHKAQKQNKKKSRKKRKSKK